MPPDDLVAFIPILRARLECGNLEELGPWAKHDWLIRDVAAEARYLLREVDRFAAMSSIERSAALSERRDVARRLGNFRSGLAEWDRRHSS